MPRKEHVPDYVSCPSEERTSSPFRKRRGGRGGERERGRGRERERERERQRASAHVTIKVYAPVYTQTHVRPNRRRAHPHSTHPHSTFPPSPLRSPPLLSSVRSLLFPYSPVSHCVHEMFDLTQTRMAVQPSCKTSTQKPVFFHARVCKGLFWCMCLSLHKFSLSVYTDVSKSLCV